MDVINNILLLHTINQLDSVNHVKWPRKIYRERPNPFKIDDIEFKKRYRYNKKTVRRIVNLIRNEIKRGPRGTAVSPELQVLIALRCWTSNEIQDDSGELHGISQGTVCRICSRVAEAIARLSHRFITLPNTLQRQERIMKEFQAIGGFQNVIGAIKCAHFKIKQPKKGAKTCGKYSRKGYYSLNVQVVCDAKLRIRDIAQWRGSPHDAGIYNESSIKERFEGNHYKGKLLGDSRYAGTPYILTPVMYPSIPQEELYNEAHATTRNTVERCFSIWNQRFQCLLNGLPFSLKNGEVVIIALAVLHNIAVDMKDYIDDLPDEVNSMVHIAENDNNIQ